MTLDPGVYFIGVGPGDPELLTVKAQRLIQSAQVIFYADSLIPPAIVSLASPRAEVIPTSGLTLEQILDLMIDRVTAGRSVARLQSGDLSLYSTLGEQLRGLRAAHIPYRLVPGIGVFQAAAAALAVELTQPELVQTIILTRYQGRASAMPPGEQLADLAAHRSTLCLYLAAQQVEKAQADLLQHYAPDTPVAICWRVGWPEEQIWRVPLGQMATTSRAHGLERSTLYIISPALDVGPGRSSLYHSHHSHVFRAGQPPVNSTGQDGDRHG
jgi:precorrin-4/cobalt-precorrin-4 C11-methyltransferase